MPATTATADTAGFTIDRARHAILFERNFAAPPAVVFEAWTIPEQVAQWWDAGGNTLERCEIDLVVGGNFTFVSPGHADKPFAGTYRRIDRPHLLEFEANGATGRVKLADQDGGTGMTVEIVCRSDEHLDQFIQFGVAVGTNKTLDNLGSYLA